MPIEVTYSPDGKGVILDHSGKVTSNEIIKTMVSIFDQPDFNKLKYWIADRTKCEEYAVKSDEAEQIAQLSKSASPRNKNLLVAFVAPQPYLYGISRMLQMLSEEPNFRIEVFNNRQDADSWIAGHI